MAQEMVKFTKLRTAIDPNFWAKFAELKLDKYKLEEKTEISVWASYSLDRSTKTRSPLLLDCTSFNENVETTSHNGTVPCSGYLINTNTFETFRQIQPEKFIETIGQHLLQSITDGTALKDPSKLTLFLVLSYADLKKYRFHYWAAYPTPFNIPAMYHQSPPQPIASKFSKSALEKFKNDFNALDPKAKCFFSIVSSSTEDLRIIPLSEGVETVKSDPEGSEKIIFGFFDPCDSPEPGWPLRNLLCLLIYTTPAYSFSQRIPIISYRGDDSLLYHLKSAPNQNETQAKTAIIQGKLVGWESNISGKMGPNIADLSQSMDPTRMAARAVDLNLKLMKWRLVPDLDLDKISKLRCLLLGAGTLGCSVARVLIGWGIKTITFVDNSTVSHSNTVRQSLYTHEDAVNRRLKAEAAREALLRICPSFNVEGVVLQIPMPGHVVGQSLLESTRSAVKTLEEQVLKHDVVFLVLDSREARWLPTVLCAAHDKIAINAALGFDSYTVQRHGTRRSVSASSPDLSVRYPAGSDLGCYFCNDVTQPGNSQVDRTLDQQCTVSRPGLSPIAAGLAVELMVGLTQHSKGVEANAFVEDGKGFCRSEREGCEGLLGAVPHTVRGSLWSHEMRLTITHRFPSCTACSAPVVNEYRERGFEFILEACNQPNYLERLAGLEDLLRNPNLDELCYAIDTSSDEEDSIILSKV
ncbi:ubiquitin-like modifier-activating enzyme atg7 [Diachasma alloeum]|uniref:ubiquitin-like modifier-activating enzyme atg7 n=1 Tax=Diachasma alloeum TaxID=454923 RepID=UPI00073825A1|nr:ubiquitin-like modifier-activating enzyme atg7 [Diachasma alloeum]XP_015108745.1 ubiquitin-like modifier-activating enzyme atg7 [Diachasma alloeum]XP_015108746.1 ubiquitin-like modifier-activating enzyme atg7 [Diachasma alloeum]XP_015108747.1 ubiquitin-like modifier-activating enzyme atg7 [Diachasma alloeum]XP_015108748.1 ubiquitin-like modifier-activating enzyme atg7 [Diachasma alloeum]XP_015108749.1 ubiquitin-like modifier-activating enzyme atg7 [Diachasma alloeum]